jgi:hypothetical protein
MYESEAAPASPTLGISKGISALHTPGKVVEVRVPKNQTSPTLAGWFDDPVKMAAALAELDGKHPAIYYTLNSCTPALLARCTNKIQPAKASTAKGDITRRDWLLVDADPVRPAGISSTDAEKEAALDTLRKVVSHLSDAGWPAPVTADSGNGYHALYKLDLPNTAEVEAAVKNVLKYLDKKFSNAAVKIDTAVHDPNRITKAYGTMAGKGENTPERPHRRSAIRRVPEELTPVPMEKLTALKSGIIIKNSNPSTNLPPVTVEKMTAFLDFYGLEYGEETERPEGGRMWIVQDCPFNPVHEYALFLTEDGVPGFKCFHSSANCNEKHFGEYHKLLQEKTGKKFIFHTNVEVTPASAPATMKLNIQKASEIKPEVIDWLWQNKIPFGKLTLFLGNPGLGKGLATMDIASRVSTASAFPDSANPYPVFDVLIFSSEDAANDTLVPRLMAVKADLTRIGIVETTTTDDGVRQFSLETDLPALRAALVENPNLRLIIIDPLLNHLGKLSGNKEQDVRAALTPLGMLAAEFKAAIIIVSHPNKRTDVEAIGRAAGAMAIVGCVRSAWFFAESKEEEGLRYMTPMKANIAAGGSGLSYETVGQNVTINGKEVEIGRIKWGEESTKTMQDLTPGEQSSKVTKADKCLTWLTGLLENGPCPQVEILAQAQANGYSKSTLDRVKHQMKIVPKQKYIDGKNQWFWSNPTYGSVSDIEDTVDTEEGL